MTTTTPVKTCFCEKCGKTMNENQFYTYWDGTKTEMCKACLTMHIDNFDPETFLWLLEKMDVPYVPQEWNVLRDRAYAKNPNLTGMSVFGKYLSKMKLKQWKDYRWKDTQEIQEKLAKEAEKAKENNKKREEFLKEQYENGEISEAQYKTMVSPAEIVSGAMPMPESYKTPTPQSQFFNEEDYLSEDDIPNPGDQLTEEDKIAMAMKWGRFYKPSEWVELERDYNNMTNSFDIQDADTINTLIIICKTNLKMNQALDQGDIEGFQKLSRVSESLRKSAKFTAAQNKEDKSDYVDCLGELVAVCEKEGFIPRYPTDIPQDKVDLTLKDMNDYLRKLVTQDLGFGQQIEDALKKIQIQKELNEAEEKAAKGEFPELQNEDYVAFLEEVEAQKLHDVDAFEEKEKEGEE